jgi:hypothetical protein
MKLAILTIAERGIPNKERLHLRVLADTNLSYYVVFVSSYTPSGLVATPPRFTYWFNSFAVKAGDSVVLYSCAGQATSSRRSDGGSDHFFHWGLPATIWNQVSDCAVLAELTDWQTSPYGS